MATNDIGRVTPIWRGFFSAASTYELNDIVIDTAGSVWWHKSEELTTGVIPEAGEIWDAVIDMSVFSGLIQAAITTAQTALAAAQEAVAEVTADTERAETAARNAEASALSASESAASVGAYAQAAEQAKNAAQTAASQAAASASSAGTSAASAGSSAQAAETSKTAAQTAASQAAGSAFDAEAWAKGTKNGTDVPSTDPTYHNNAKYWSEQAEETAADIEASSEQIAENASDIGDLKTQIKTQLKPYIIYADNPSIVGGVSAISGDDLSGTTTRRTGFIDISQYSEFVYTRLKLTSAPSHSVGMAFYDANQTFIPGSGQSVITDGDTFGYELESVKVPENAVYARFTWNVDLPNEFCLYNVFPFNYKDLYNELYNAIFPTKTYFATNIKGGVSPNDGSDVTGSSTRRTGYIDISQYSEFVYTRLKLTSAPSRSVGMAFYDANQTFIPGSGQSVITDGDTFGYELESVKVPENAVYARFTWNVDLMGLFYIAIYVPDSIAYKVNQLEKRVPDYSGKKVSILGDSISTFCANSEKVDGKAGENCVTNYPGNVVQYQNSDVTSANAMWWGQVLNYFDMVLGINESWAGSCIAYNPNQTSSGKYTADNCLCSQTRIDHLDENGTPDIIIVFGGTNDINHHRLSDSQSLRYAVGELDSTHNPLDYDNFPMETDTYYGSITTMLLRLQHTYPNATILMLLPYFCTSTHTSSGDRATPYDQNTWANVAIDVCKYLGVEYLDLRNIINLYDVSTLLFDGLHPKANGMTAIAKAVIHKLDSML